MLTELEILRRAHELFADDARPRALGRTAVPPEAIGREAMNTEGLPATYRDNVRRRHGDLVAARRTDDELSAILRQAHADNSDARRLTAAVLTAAHADAGPIPDSPLAQRELLRRRAARIRAQRSHVLTARRRARRRLTELLALRYGNQVRHGRAVPTARAKAAVRAALTRLGRPYVWGATGPDRFDCSGLVQWAYAQAGVRLDRTTYDQINDGIAVARSQVRPGDLVFPHAGHVQLAIGDNLVVEAPHAGATVRISRIGANVAIRRVVGG